MIRTALEIAMERLAQEPPPLHGQAASDPPTCSTCIFGIFKDYGYSNWTVEGTEFFCAIKKHPADGFDRFYGDDKRLAYAAQCDMYRQGVPVNMDVDGEDYSDLTDAQKALYDVWNGEPIKPPTYPHNAQADSADDRGDTGSDEA